MGVLISTKNIFTQGLILAEDDTVISKRWLTKKVEQVKLLHYPTGFYYTMKRYAEQWLAFTKDLAQIKKELLAMHGSFGIKLYHSMYHAGFQELVANLVQPIITNASDKKLFPGGSSYNSHLVF